MGYGGLEPERFLEALRSAGCRVVVDVRRFPRSRVEFYTGERLRAALEAAGISYTWAGELGALGMARSYRPSEPVECTSSPTFRAYVAYLTSEPEPLAALGRLRAMAAEGLRPLILCRERRPEHCHRQFISDALLAMGVEVVHIVGGERIRHTGSPCYRYIAAKLRVSMKTP